MKSFWIVALVANTVFAAHTVTVYPEKHYKGLVKKTVVPVAKPVTWLDFPNTIPPQKMDLRGQISPIKNQGACGSCWSFSLTATLQDLLKLSGKNLDLSQQYLVDCATNSFGCRGGYFDAADFLVVPKGSPLATDYPYTAKDGRCKSKPVVASVVEWHMIGGSKGPTVRDIQTVMAATNAPVSITVAAGAGSWERYRSGIYDGCRSAGTDHMINIVGWDNEGASYDKNGNLPPGKGYWILRNSWGTSWGEQGFMRSRITDSRGRRCNNVAEEAAYLVLKK